MRKNLPSLMVLTMLCSAATLAIADDQAASQPRVEVVTRLGNAIRVQLADPAASKADANAAIKLIKADLEQDAAKELPEFISAPSADILNAIPSEPLRIQFSDPVYCRAAAKFWIMSVPMEIAYLQKFPPLTDSQIAALRSFVARVKVRIQTKMEEKLLPLKVGGLDKARIAKEVDQWVGGISRRVGRDRESQFTRIPLGATDAEQMANDFTDRLESSMPLIQQELGPATTKSLDSPHPNTRDGAISMVLFEILMPTQHAILDRMNDPALKDFNPEDIAPPGWSQARKDYTNALNQCSARLKSHLATRPTTLP
jgi:hypothetical protein